MTGMPDPTQTDVTQRNIWWSMEFTRLCIDNHELRDSLPDDAMVVLLPESDQELCRFNLDLAGRTRAAGELVFVTIPTTAGTVGVQLVHTEPQRRFEIA